VDLDRAKRADLAAELGVRAQYDSYRQALAEVGPEAVSISTWPDTHAEFALGALQAGAHVFVEKPLGRTAAEAEEVVATAAEAKRKLYVGYILRSHPGWMRFIEIGRTLGRPLVMRMNLNQQSRGPTWEVHKQLMASMSPIVDCGVHYVDVMSQLTGARPDRVHAIGVRLSGEIDREMYNYGQLQVVFDDDSIGWYEAGWGPMMSEAAFFVKDLVGPLGSLTIESEGAKPGRSDDITAHIMTSRLRLHRTRGGPDEIIEIEEEPDHQGMCDRQQEIFFAAIAEDRDLAAHHRAVLDSLRIVLAADQSIREGRAIEL